MGRYYPMDSDSAVVLQDKEIAMSRYIDADAWWKAVQKHYTDGDCADNDRYELGINVGITKSRNVMMDAPSIDICFCKECKHTDGEPPIADGRSWCRKHYAYMYYCSDGERSSE